MFKLSNALWGGKFPVTNRTAFCGNIKMNEFTETIITNACIDIIHTNALKLGSSYLIKLDCIFEEEKHYANTSLRPGSDAVLFMCRT